MRNKMAKTQTMSQFMLLVWNEWNSIFDLSQIGKAIKATPNKKLKGNGGDLATAFSPLLSVDTQLPDKLQNIRDCRNFFANDSVGKIVRLQVSESRLPEALKKHLESTIHMPKPNTKSEKGKRTTRRRCQVVVNEITQKIMLHTHVLVIYPLSDALNAQ